MVSETSPTDVYVLPDAIARQWLIRATPAAWHPYLQLARLDRPIGYWLLVLPCWWSSAFASVVDGERPDVLHLILFLVGAIVMRGSGSTYNDIVDRDLDAKVERTRHRPVASGRVGVRAAKVFLVAQALVGFVVVIQFNRFTILLGIGSLAIVAIYPFMKRFSSLPQVVLGLAFAWGGLVGWAAHFGSLARPAVLLYAGAVFWTIGYDTIYAIQDARDDPRRRHQVDGAPVRRARPPGRRLDLHGDNRLDGGGARRRRRRGPCARANRRCGIRAASRLAGHPHRTRRHIRRAAPVPLQPPRGTHPVRGTGSRRAGRRRLKKDRPGR